MHVLIEIFDHIIPFSIKICYNNIVFNKNSYISRHGKQQKYINFFKNLKLNALLLDKFIQLIVCLLLKIFIEY